MHTAHTGQNRGRRRGNFRWNSVSCQEISPCLSKSESTVKVNFFGVWIVEQMDVGFFMRRQGEAKIGLLLLSLLCVAWGLMIGPCSFAQDQTPPPNYSRFRHSTHNEKNKKGKLVCRDCHSITPSQVRRTLLPPHQACMRCHVEQFTAKDQKICAVCHTSQVENKVPQLRAFPDFELPTEFAPIMNHRAHVDPQDPAVLKFHLLAKCEACHKESADGLYMTVPGHPECQECHDKPNVKPPMSDCGGCHHSLPGNQAGSLTAYVRPVAGKFNHQHHEMDPKTHEKIECVKCHTTATESKELATLKAPPMDRCTDCHNGEVVNKKEIFSWGYCLKCHIAAAVTQKIRQPWPDRQQRLEGLRGTL